LYLSPNDNPIRVPLCIMMIPPILYQIFTGNYTSLLPQFFKHQLTQICTTTEVIRIDFTIYYKKINVITAFLFNFLLL